jgi:hypothetical protein
MLRMAFGSDVTLPLVSDITGKIHIENVFQQLDLQKEDAMGGTENYILRSFIICIRNQMLLR